MSWAPMIVVTEQGVEWRHDCGSSVQAKGLFFDIDQELADEWGVPVTTLVPFTKVMLSTLASLVTPELGECFACASEPPDLEERKRRAQAQLTGLVHDAMQRVVNEHPALMRRAILVHRRKQGHGPGIVIKESKQ